MRRLLGVTLVLSAAWCSPGSAQLCYDSTTDTPYLCGSPQPGGPPAGGGGPGTAPGSGVTIELPIGGIQPGNALENFVDELMDILGGGSSDAKDAFFNDFNAAAAWGDRQMMVSNELLRMNTEFADELIERDIQARRDEDADYEQLNVIWDAQMAQYAELDDGQGLFPYFDYRIPPDHPDYPALRQATIDRLEARKRLKDHAAEFAPSSFRDAALALSEHYLRMADALYADGDGDGARAYLEAAQRAAAATFAPSPLREPRSGKFGLFELVDAGTLPSAPGLDATNRYFVRGAAMSEHLTSWADRIYRSFVGQGGQRLDIVSGDRPPDRQANAMFVRFRQGGNVQDYINQAAAQEIFGVYNANNGTMPDHELVAMMTATIEQQVANNNFVSSHQQGNALDLRTIGLTPAQKQQLREAVQAIGLEVHEEGTPPHFHIKVPAPVLPTAPPDPSPAIYLNQYWPWPNDWPAPEIRLLTCNPVDIGGQRYRELLPSRPAIEQIAWYRPDGSAELLVGLGSDDQGDAAQVARLLVAESHLPATGQGVLVTGALLDSEEPLIQDYCLLD